jgi:nicotinate-nucleotide pyrophosphorylase (carboxylating)
VDCELGIPGYILEAIVTRALDEDIGTGDITSRCTVDEGTPCRAEIAAKDTGVVAGISVAEAVFRRLDPDAAFSFASHDGERVAPGQVILGIAGDTQAILIGERTALNFLQRMSGIATLTAEFVEAVKGTNARICDTRKTAPGLRVLDKYAVRAGGGRNHRFGLSDGVLIKDNHIRAAGGIGEAVRRARESAHHLLAIEVETQTAGQVEEAMRAGADVIMLDNMGLDDVREAVRFIAGRCRTEVSGNVNLTTVRAYAECGVDLISVGALTHSVSALDLSLEIIDARG